MVFSSQLFLFYFLPTVLGAYYLAPRRLKHGVLTLASYLFYGWANPLFTPLMFASTVIDYFCGLAAAEGGQRRRLAVTVSICSNLSLLGFFKYFNFAVASYDGFVQWLGWAGADLDLALRITLPLGISFYTFQSMSYTIDVYRGRVRANRNFIDFACYVSMFPQLVAGPIVRFSDVADQLLQRRHTLTKFARGISFLALGLAKKVLLANTCGKVADLVFDAGAIDTAQAWFGVIAYAFQIYFDFSGYSDMAIGLGLMFGFCYPKNFDSPYHSQSITEFWQRWHISLSSWLRDYLYIPLGGNQRGKRRTYCNLAIVMLLGGLWHGAAWNFVIWGAIHGAMLAGERLLGKTSPYHRLPGPVRVGITFVIVLFSWVFFRAATLPAAVAYCATMLGAGDAGAGLLSGLIFKPYYLIIVAVAGLVTWTCPQTWDFTRRITPLKLLVILVLLWLALGVLFAQAYNPFIYFIF